MAATTCLENNRIRVLIADDEPSLVEALADLLGGEAGFEVVGRAADADEAIAMAAQQAPDVALLDVRMPGGGGPRAAREIHAQNAGVKIIALSAYDDRATVLEMLRAGASGYLVKGTGPDEILETLRRSVRGGGALSGEVATQVIEELVGLLSESERLARELHAYQRQRAELVQNLSHELLTPTTVIQGSGHLLAQHGARMSTEQLNGVTTNVSQATDRLRRTVGKVALMARLSSEGPDEEAVLADAAELMCEAVARCGVQADRVVVRTDPPTAACAVQVYPKLVVEALDVLLDNALSLSTGAVELSVRTDEAGFVFSVDDRGPGLGSLTAEKMFEPFVQGDGSETRRHGGLGMGLALARLIMDTHRGAIEYAAREGGGSTFTLRFPVVVVDGGPR